MTDQASGFRCSVASRTLGEPPEGTASTVRSFLLLESAGAWGAEVTRDSRLPDEVKEELSRLERRHGVRPLLIRRPGRAPSGPVRVFAAHVRGGQPWMETTSLADVRELLDLDLDGLGQGRSPGLEPHPGPVLLVCTHGKHDLCCAERGRPVSAALFRAAPEQTWEVSHIGGDRFAANALVLPHGLYYGRLEADEAAAFAAAHLRGEVDLDHLRGRASYPFSVQAGEVFLRRHLDERRIDAVTLLDHVRHGTDTTALFAARGGRWRVRVHTAFGEKRQLTCRATATSVGPTHTLVDLAPAEATT